MSRSDNFDQENQPKNLGLEKLFVFEIFGHLLHMFDQLEFDGYYWWLNWAQENILNRILQS